MPFYLLVIAPCDQSYVGPFPTEDSAQEWRCEFLDADKVDALIKEESDMRADMAEHGELDICAPNEYESD